MKFPLLSVAALVASTSAFGVNVSCVVEGDTKGFGRFLVLALSPGVLYLVISYDTFLLYSITIAPRHYTGFNVVTKHGVGRQGLPHCSFHSFC